MRTMTVIPTEIVENMLFTPPERGLMCEQAEGLKVDTTVLISAIVEGDNKAVLEAFQTMTEHMEYMNSILQAKVQNSMRRLHNRMHDE